VSEIDNMIDRLTDRQRHEFALACSRRVAHLMRDLRSVAALDTRDWWLRGEATDEEMAATWAAAQAAAQAAARAAAWAASDAADAAAWAAAWAVRNADAAGEADSVRAAAAEAEDAERAWQHAELERMLEDGGAA
jgi:hypothetical protein